MRLLAAVAAVLLAGCTGEPPREPDPLAELPSVRLLVKAGGDPLAVVAARVEAVAHGLDAQTTLDHSAPRASALVASPELAKIGWLVVDAGGVPPDMLAASLRMQAGVTAVEVDARARLIDPVAGVEAGPRVALDPMVGSQWVHAKVGSAAAWDAGLDGRGVTIAVIDTGVDCSHPDLRCRNGGRDFTGGGSTADVVGHGTHVAGTAAAVGSNGRGGSGMAPRADVLPVKVLDDSGTGDYSWVAAGIVWASDQGARVLNLSLGGPVPSAALRDALTYATSRGALVACAAGNDGTDRASYPNTYPGCIGVAATRKDGEVGTTWTNWGVNADIAIGGESIMSTCTGGRYCQMSGTSMAAPALAGVLALALQGGVAPHSALDLVNRTGVALTGRLAGLRRPDMAALAAAIRAAPSATPLPSATATRVPPTATRRPATSTPTAGGPPAPTVFPGPTHLPPSALPWPCAVVGVEAGAVTIRCPYQAPPATP